MNNFSRSKRLRITPLKANQQGFLLPAVLTFMIAMAILSGAVLEVVLNNFNVVGNNQDSQKAFNIAEAGINYYLWHLSHNATDFKDGQSTPTTPDANLGYGPYIHNYIDSNSANVGTYTLWIKPQGSGSTIATVRAIGKAKGSNVTRTVQAQIGAPSFASYAVASDSALWFGSSEAADGPVHSNQGIRMDGASNAEISSANTTYVPPNTLGGNGTTSYPGVWCNTSVTAPVDCTSRDKSNWVYPATAIDFNQVSSSLCTMKKVAFNDYSATSSLATQSTACSQTPTTRTNAYIPQLSTSFSVSKGYLLILNNDSTYDLYKVNSENDRAVSPYTNALNTTLVASGVGLPPSGVIFTEDNVWVLSKPGTSFKGRVTIASGRLATTNNTNIVIAGSLLYSTKNGSDAIGLVAEDSIMVAPYAPPSSGSFNFEVDGALLAQTGNVMYGEAINSNNQSVYRTSSSACTRGWNAANQTMTFYGSIATRQIWTWSWLVGGASCGDAVYDASNGYLAGIKNNITQYDYNLQYAPPPSYPVTNGYNILGWREILTKP